MLVLSNHFLSFLEPTIEGQLPLILFWDSQGPQDKAPVERRSRTKVREASSEN
jgi:hypothetical protein